VNGTLASLTTGGGPGETNAAYGIWCAHLVINGNYDGCAAFQVIQWGAFVSIKDGVTGQTSQLSTGSSFCFPTPGAIALLAIAGFSTRRRRH
jgi:hypothetical protein